MRKKKETLGLVYKKEGFSRLILSMLVLQFSVLKFDNTGQRDSFITIRNFHNPDDL